MIMRRKRSISRIYSFGEGSVGGNFAVQVFFVT